MSDPHAGMSRRGFLALLGIGGAAVCSGMGVMGWAVLCPREVPSHTVYITATPVTDEVLRYPSLIRRETWGALPPDHLARNESGFYNPQNLLGWRRYDAPLDEVYQTVVIHHSVIDEGTDRATLLEIQRAHREDRGWADVGYHFFIGQRGQVYEGRELGVRGTHVGGFNTGSVGICFLGNYVQQRPVQPQIDSAIALIRWLADTLQLSHLAGHYQFNPGTQCPGINLLSHLGSLAALTGLQLGVEGYIPPTPQAAVPCPCCATIS